MPIDAGIANPNAFYQGADNANKLLQSFATRRAGKQLSAGDETGAVQTLQNSGQLTEADQMQQHQLAIQENVRAYHTKMIGEVATTLDNIGTQEGWDHVLPAYDKLIPVFKQQGMSDADIQQYRSMVASDPSIVKGLSANAAKHMEQYTLNPGDKRFDASGKQVASGSPRYQTLGSDQRLYEEPTGGAATPPATTGGEQSGNQASDTPLAFPEDPDLTGKGGLPDFAAVRTVESGGDQTAVSPKGAEGDMQVMPNTQTNPGYGVRPAQPGPDGQIPAEELSRVGRDYLTSMVRHYGPTLGHIAYNWGPKRMERWIARGAKLQELPSDVKQYLGSVLVAHARGQALPTPTVQHPDEEGMPHRTVSQFGSEPRMVAEGMPSYRPPTEQEQKDYPGVVFMTPKGPHMAAANSAAGASQTMPSDDAITAGAQLHLVTGKWPPTGMGNNVVRKAYQDREAEIMKKHGWNGADVANLQAQYKADNTALSKMQTQRSQIGAYEETVQGSIGMVKEFGPKAMSNTGFQFTNKAQNWWKRETNDPDMLSLDNAVGTVVQEYAKVISNATGGGVTSDQARERAEKLVNQAGDVPSLLAQLKVLQREMDFRVNSMDKGMERLTGHIHMMLDGPKHADTVVKGLSKPTKTGHYDPAAGKVVWQ
jgi:hypothetical protein